MLPPVCRFSLRTECRCRAMCSADNEEFTTLGDLDRHFPSARHRKTMDYASQAQVIAQTTSVEGHLTESTEHWLDR